jgi:hypothetical protein
LLINSLFDKLLCSTFKVSLLVFWKKKNADMALFGAFLSFLAFFSSKKNYKKNFNFFISIYF